MKKTLLLLVVLAVGGYDFFLGDGELISLMLDDQSASQQFDSVRGESNVENSIEISNSSSDQLLQQAFQNRQSDLQIEGAGVVERVLSDDNDGDRHQRFILGLSNGQTLLVAHNIDLAPRIESISEGDVVQFYGEYEWTDRGGVMHWTHHDPGGRHEDGWLKHEGRIYQ